jgi:hypothetical protein
MVSFRNRLGAILAIIGGSLLVIGGGVGMVDLLQSISKIVEEHISQDPNIALLFKILIYFAALGGISVIIGGILIYLEFPLAAKILIILGAGIGLFGLIFGLAVAYMSGDADQYVNSLMSTIAGIGAILSIIAYYLAK